MSLRRFRTGINYIRAKLIEKRQRSLKEVEEEKLKLSTESEKAQGITKRQ